MLQPIQWSHVNLLARTHAKYSIRGGSGLIYLLAFLMVGLLIGGMMFDTLRAQIDQQIKALDAEKAERGGAGPKLDDKVAVEAITKFARPFIAWLVGADEKGGKEIDPHVEHLVVEKPPLLSAYLLLLLGFIPFTSCLASFNQLSGDIGTKGLRYLLLRTERINIIVARFLGTVLFTAALSLSTMMLIVVYLAVQFDSHSFVDLLGWGINGWFAVMMLSLPYLCMGTLLSAAMDTPIATLVLCLLVTGFPILLLKFPKWTLPNGDDYAWLERLTPWGWKYDLLHSSFIQISLATLVMLAFSAALGFLALRHFLKRDL